MKRRLILAAVALFMLALTASAADETTFEFATSLPAAQEMSQGEKPILLDFYTEW